MGTCCCRVTPTGESGFRDKRLQVSVVILTPETNLFIDEVGLTGKNLAPPAIPPTGIPTPETNAPPPEDGDGYIIENQRFFSAGAPDDLRSAYDFSCVSPYTRECDRWVPELVAGGFLLKAESNPSRCLILSPSSGVRFDTCRIAGDPAFNDQVFTDVFTNLGQPANAKTNLYNRFPLRPLSDTTKCLELLSAGGLALTPCSKNTVRQRWYDAVPKPSKSYVPEPVPTVSDAVVDTPTAYDYAPSVVVLPNGQRRIFWCSHTFAKPESAGKQGDVIRTGLLDSGVYEPENTFGDVRPLKSRLDNGHQCDPHAVVVDDKIYVYYTGNRQTGGTEKTIVRNGEQTDIAIIGGTVEDTNNGVFVYVANLQGKPIAFTYKGLQYKAGEGANIVPFSAALYGNGQPAVIKQGGAWLMKYRSNPVSPPKNDALTTIRSSSPLFEQYTTLGFNNEEQGSSADWYYDTTRSLFVTITGQCAGKEPPDGSNWPSGRGKYGYRYQEYDPMNGSQLNLLADAASVPPDAAEGPFGYPATAGVKAQAAYFKSPLKVTTGTPPVTSEYVMDNDCVDGVGLVHNADGSLPDGKLVFYRGRYGSPGIPLAENWVIVKGVVDVPSAPK